MLLWIYIASKNIVRKKENWHIQVTLKNCYSTVFILKIQIMKIIYKTHKNHKKSKILLSEIRNTSVNSNKFTRSFSKELLSADERHPKNTKHSVVQRYESNNDISRSKTGSVTSSWEGSKILSIRGLSKNTCIIRMWSSREIKEVFTEELTWAENLRKLRN